MGPAVSAEERLYHGGVPGLGVGDLLEPGHARATHDGCAWCEARMNGEAYLGIDGPSEEENRVYATTHRLYAKSHASLYGLGDLYAVEAVGSVADSDEDTIATVHAPAFRVLAVADRAVRLTDKERRRLFRDWTAADAEAGDLSAKMAIR